MTEPRDIVLRVPQTLYLAWLAEGDWPGEETTGEWAFGAGCKVPALGPGARAYACSFGVLRGYAPLLPPRPGCTTAWLRAGGAVAVTVPSLDLRAGRWAWKYRTWDRSREVPVLEPHAWATLGLPLSVLADVHRLIRLRQNPDYRRIIRHRAIHGARTANQLFHGIPA